AAEPPAAPTSARKQRLDKRSPLPVPACLLTLSRSAAPAGSSSARAAGARAVVRGSLRDQEKVRQERAQVYGYVQVVDELGADPLLPQDQADGGACLAGIVGHQPRVLRPRGF